MDSHLEILEETLRLRHLAPTAPDTLGWWKEANEVNEATCGSKGSVGSFLTFCLFQVATHIIKEILSSWKIVPTFTSVAMPQLLTPSSSKVSELCFGRSTVENMVHIITQMSE